MADVSGSLRSVTLAGLPYAVSAEAGATAILTGWENSRIAHSGGSMRKMIKRVRTVSGVVLILGGSDRSNLTALADSSEDITLAFEDASGNSYKATGSIEFENWETEDNKCTLTMQAEDEWTPVLAG
jgi:TRAP-type uncharacterized transport system substrate-binding protein